MKTIRRLQFMYLALIMGGCASSASRQKVEVKVQESPQVYRKSIEPVWMGQVSTAVCARTYPKLKTHWVWKDAIDVATSCLKVKDLQKAEDTANDLAVHEPSAPWGPFFLASVARERKNYERALWMVEMALKRGPDVALIHYLKGQILWDQKDFNASVVSFEKSLSLDDNLYPAHLLLGQVYFRDQDYSKASKHFYAVLKKDSRNQIALAGLAESQLQDNNPRGALDAYSRLAERYPSDGQYLTRIAEIYENVLNDPGQALSTYRQIKEAMRGGTIRMNQPANLEAKIKDLEGTTRKSRSVASTEKGGK